MVKWNPNYVSTWSYLALLTMSLNGVGAIEGSIRLCSTAVYPNKSYESSECCEGGSLTRISYSSTVMPRTETRTLASITPNKTCTVAGTFMIPRIFSDHPIQGWRWKPERSILVTLSIVENVSCEWPRSSRSPKAINTEASVTPPLHGSAN